MFELIFMSLLGLLFFYLGWLIWKRQKISLIIDYHHVKVAEEDKGAYTAEIGRALILMGVGCLLTGIIDFLSSTRYGWWFFIILLVLGYIKMYRAQMKYNKGIF